MAASTANGYLIDTSVLIAVEQDRALAELPRDGSWHVSVVTVGELKRGVLAASDTRTRATRLETWLDARQTFQLLPVDDVVAETWGEFQAIAAAEDRRPALADSLIAATAATFGLTLVTQDRGFAWFPDLDVLVV